MVSLSALGLEFSARRTLKSLHDQLGAGLLVAAAVPGLTAAIDQHSAAVRDIVTMGVEGSAAVAGVVLLAGYARGLVDAAKESGWRLTSPADWTQADWFTARLLAVCSLAKRIDEPDYHDWRDVSVA
ncbi:hypothetical protein HFP15_23315 [Amycolatopsis sp. K13G38]|uniref:Uncharacterized protein n=1 Tax=Amycolatopsis acididurans TaxID=2724524 RepID=A0ABX1JBR6_9PSEU|nr:DUF6401 family natural product biosynthesis protein [Amycolatopsis acididurans]NKQ55810.1 hypothetical protein [Amycolatopsis acididurans]